MNKTSIEWVKNPDGTQGYTWNPITGCLNGCPYCYARRLANGRLKARYLANKNLASFSPAILYSGASQMVIQECFRDPFYPRFWPERLNEPLKISKPRGIFVVDMGELFGDWVPIKWQKEIMDCVQTYDNDRFYLLTKQPQNLQRFSPFPDNCYVGVTATGNAMFWKALSYLKDIRATVKYLSIEPFLEPIKPMLSPFTNFELNYEVGIGKIADSLRLAGINWLIIGAQTKPNVYPKIEWVEEIVQAASAAGIPVFFKDNLWSLFDGSKYAVPLWAFNKDKKGRLRQEMPVEFKRIEG